MEKHLMKHFALPLLITVTLSAPAFAKDPAPAAPPRPPSPGAKHSPRAPLWSYDGDTGPTKWSEVDPKFKGCQTGKRQSPIDIETQFAERGGVKPVMFNYAPGSVVLVNGNNTIQVNFTNSGSARFDGLEHKLVQMVFHAPSEEKIDGIATPMGAQLIHRAGDTRTAILAIRFKLGKENKTLKPIFERLPTNDAFNETVDNFNPADLLPPNPAYFSYTGSLTIPPCTEGISWYVMRQTVDISYKQLAAFQKLYKSNSRPTQPLNGRRVMEYIEQQ
jgi:carbonic anhydrase